MADAFHTPPRGADPLFSDVLAEPAQLWEVVEQFVRELPQQVQAMQKALAEGQSERVAAMAAHLKRAGHSHGCVNLARRAAELEAAAASDAFDELQRRIDSLCKLTAEIQAAIQRSDGDTPPSV